MTSIAWNALQKAGANVERWVHNLQTRNENVQKVRKMRQVASKMNNNREYFKRNYGRALVAFSALSMANKTLAAKHDTRVFFDTDVDTVGIDNRCSACISHCIDDFKGPLRDTKRSIKGFGGTRTANLKMGTIVWKWADNEGKVHKFCIPNSYYSPTGGVRLLSPQHWAKT